MNVRIANIKDIDNNLLKLYIAGFSMHYEKRKDIFAKKSDIELRKDLIYALKDPYEIILVIENNEKIVGYIKFKYKIKEPKAIWIDELVIDSNHKKKGYGKRLIEEVTLFAEKNNCKRIELNCWSFNEDALKFYEKIGFIQQRIIFEKEVQ